MIKKSESVKKKAKSKSQKDQSEQTALGISNQVTTSIAVVYDRISGRILKIHRSEAVEGVKGVKPKLDGLLKDAKSDAFTLRMATKGDGKNLAVMEIPVDGPDPAGKMVDVGADKLVPKYQIQLAAAKSELEGDGKDSTVIEINVVDVKGKRVTGFNAEVEIRASRGKLSERGGRLQLAGGRGKIKLTSVAETAVGVTVAAQSLGPPCESTAIELAFM